MFRKYGRAALGFSTIIFFHMYPMKEWKENTYTFSLFTFLEDPSCESHKKITKTFEISNISHNNKGAIGFNQEITYRSNKISESNVSFKQVKHYVLFDMNKKKFFYLNEEEERDIKELKNLLPLEKHIRFNSEYPHSDYTYTYINEEHAFHIDKDNNNASSFRCYARNKDESLVIGSLQETEFFIFSVYKFYLFESIDHNKNIVMCLKKIVEMPELNNYEYPLINKMMFTDNDTTILALLTNGKILKIAV